MYGLTECKRVSIMPSGMAALKPGSVGLPLPGTSTRVMGSDGRPLPPGQVGELVVLGPHLTDGYWGDEEESGRRFKRDPLTGERLLFTRDLFRQDEDGFLYFMGRKETFIKSRGHRVSPFELETFLIGLEGVHEAAVVGIPNEETGEAIYAFITQAGPRVDQEQVVIAACRRELRLEFCPARVVVSQTPLPRTENGKLDRQSLRRTAIRLASEVVPSGSPGPEQPAPSQ